MKAVYALYADPESAQRAVDSLRESGVADRDITIISSEPFEQYEFGRRDPITWLPWISGLGGLLGMGFGYWLTSATQEAWPLPTGGMPIVPMWSNLIIMFELTMFGGTFATIATLLISARLPSWHERLYDLAVSDGKVLVGVVDPPESAMEDLERRLSGAGRAEVTTLR